MVVLKERMDQVEETCMGRGWRRAPGGGGEDRISEREQITPSKVICWFYEVGGLLACKIAGWIEGETGQETSVGPVWGAGTVEKAKTEPPCPWDGVEARPLMGQVRGPMTCK